jgi:hypothetical protein
MQKGGWITPYPLGVTARNWQSQQSNYFTTFTAGGFHDPSMIDGGVSLGQ